MSILRQFAKEGVWIAIGQLATIAASLVLVRELTMHITPVEYGQLALGLTIAGLIDQVIMGGVINGASRFYSIAQQKSDLSAYFLAVRYLFGISSLTIIFLGVITIVIFELLGFGRWFELVTLTLIFSITSACNSVVNSIQNAARHRELVAFHGCLDAWLKIGMALFFIKILGPSSYVVVMGFVASGVLTIISQLFCLRNKISGINSKSGIAKDYWVKQIWEYSRPFALWGGLGWAQQSSSRWALEFFTTTENVGLYSVLSQLSYTPIVIFTGMTMTFLMPIFFERFGDGSNRSKIQEVKALTRAIAMTGLVVTTISFFVAVFFHSYIFQVLTGKLFSQISFLMPYLVLAGGLFAIAQIYASRIMAMLMTKKITAASTASSVIGIASSFIGIYFFSLTGAAVAMMIHAASYLLFILLVIRSLDRHG